MSEITEANEASVDRLERFESVCAGNYCRAICEVDERFIPKGQTLLIQSLRYADDKLHTVILRPHPDFYGRTYRIEVGEDSYIHTELTEHRFLLDDYLQQFEYQPDHEAIRESETSAIQSQVAQLQSDLVHIQSDPERMKEIVQTRIKIDIEAAENSSSVPLAQPLIDASALPQSLSQAVAENVTSDVIDKMTIMAEQQKAIAIAQSKWMIERTSEITETLEKLTPFYLETAAAALAATEDTQNTIKKMMSGIDTLKLYTGEEVVVQTISTGASAPTDVPLSVCARKLLVDEELSVYLDLSEWFDFSDLDSFDKALNEHPSLIDQIFTSERCALVMATTQRYIDYGGAWANMYENERNSAVFLMIRDGENIHRVFSPVTSHLGSSNLFPSQSQQDAVFKGVDGQNIGYNDVQYSDALADHEVFALHYKRWLVLCAGLDHRLNLFGDFYSKHNAPNFLSLEFQQRYLRFIDDAVNVIESTPESGHESVRDWMRRANEGVRSGSRVLTSSNNAITEESAPGAFSYNQFSRGYNCNVKTSSALEVHMVTKKGAAANVAFKLERSTWTSGDDLYTFNADLYKLNLEGAYLCLDHITRSELRRYIYNRRYRRFHLSYMRLFKTALQFLEEEATNEALEFETLTTVLTQCGLANTEGEAHTLSSVAVRHWRVANRGRSICGLDTKSRNSIVSFAYFFKNKDSYIRELESLELFKSHQLLRVVFTGRANLVVYYEPLECDQDNRLYPHAFVHRSKVNLNKSGISVESPKWSLLLKYNAGESTLVEYSEYSKPWLDRVDHFGPPETKKAHFDVVDNWRATLELILTDHETRQTIADEYRSYRDHLHTKSKSVCNRGMAIPIGIEAMYKPHMKPLATIFISVEDVLGFLATIDPDAVHLYRSQYVGCYSDRDFANDDFSKMLNGGDQWKVSSAGGLWTKPMSSIGNIQFINQRPIEARNDPIRNHPLPSFHLLQHISKHGKDRKACFENGLEEDGFCAIDSALGLDTSNLKDKVAISTYRYHESRTGRVFTIVDAAVSHEHFPKLLKRSGFNDDHYLRGGYEGGVYKSIKKAFKNHDEHFKDFTLCSDDCPVPAATAPGIVRYYCL